MFEQIGNKCCGCASCATICPHSCISMEYNEEGFLYPVVQTNACIKCGLCKRACPVSNAKAFIPNPIKEAWGLIANNQSILLNSSSGGLFTLLAEKILKERGCVFGAAFTDDFQHVRHIMVENNEALSLLRGSKYMQSVMSNCYQVVKEQLKAGRKVLFSGTPCQIAGLKSFLGKDSDFLLCVDVICHGTPPAKLWQKYLRHIEKKTKGVVKSVNFRHKENGWKRFGLEAPMSGNVRYYRAFQQDPYMKMFLRNYCLRESCYQCNVKNSGSVADVTIGDFWGVENVAPEINSYLGVSLVLIHTEKGKEYFERIKPYMFLQRVDYEQSIAYNRVVNTSVRRPPERDVFFFDLPKLDWDKLECKYTKEKLTRRIKRKLSSLIRGRLRKKNGENVKMGGEDKRFLYGLLVDLGRYVQD